MVAEKQLSITLLYQSVWISGIKMCLPISGSIVYERVKARNKSNNAQGDI